MKSAYRVWLDGRSLEEVDASILITDVVEHGPKMKIASCANARYDGLRLVQKTRQSLSVNVVMEIRERNRARRQDILERIACWAYEGKYLSISTRPGQRLRVTLAEMPEDISSQGWAQAAMLTFTAYAIPYWEDEAPVKAFAHGKNGSVGITPGGCMPCFLEAAITNTGGGVLTHLKLQVSGQVMELQGLQAAPGEKISLGYDDEGMLHLPFPCRTAASCDDLLLTPGKRQLITFEADENVTITFSARGRRL